MSIRDACLEVYIHLWLLAWNNTRGRHNTDGVCVESGKSIKHHGNVYDRLGLQCLEHLLVVDSYKLLYETIF